MTTGAFEAESPSLWKRAIARKERLPDMTAGQLCPTETTTSAVPEGKDEITTDLTTHLEVALQEIVYFTRDQLRVGKRKNAFSRNIYKLQGRINNLLRYIYQWRYDKNEQLYRD